MTASCLIIGAGMAGLMAAQSLQANGWTVTVVDKGRGVGGRMATRRIENAVFDHGAQFFTVRDPSFASWVQQWEAAGIATVWSHGLPTPSDLSPSEGYARYRGASGMAAIAKRLASSLTVHTSTRIVQLQQDVGWIVTAEDGQIFAADALMLTAPVPQSLELLANSHITLPPDVQQSLSEIAYHPCFAVMAVLDGPSNIPVPGALQIQEEPIAWLADNQQKGISPQSAVTIHAGPAFTREYLEADLTEVGQVLLAAAEKWLGSSVVTFQVHRWLYSQPIHPYPARMLRVDVPAPLVFAGDAFDGPRVEGAALSGLAAAQALTVR